MNFGDKSLHTITQAYNTIQYFNNSEAKALKNIVKKLVTIITPLQLLCFISLKEKDMLSSIKFVWTSQGIC